MKSYYLISLLKDKQTKGEMILAVPVWGWKLKAEMWAKPLQMKIYYEHISIKSFCKKKSSHYILINIVELKWCAENSIA